jgi:aprataxin and PNK-like factor
LRSYAPPSLNLVKSNDKPRPVCSYGASCYRKNLAHRTEQSHPGDSDYEDEKNTTKDDNDADKPQCPYGKTCYRQNPQHKLDYKH